jgi:hypothetical protein
MQTHAAARGPEPAWKRGCVVRRRGTPHPGTRSSSVSMHSGGHGRRGVVQRDPGEVTSTSIAACNQDGADAAARPCALCAVCIVVSSPVMHDMHDRPHSRMILLDHRPHASSASDLILDLNTLRDSAQLRCIPSWCYPRSCGCKSRGRTLCPSRPDGISQRDQNRRQSSRSLTVVVLCEAHDASVSSEATSSRSTGSRLTARPPLKY